MASSDESWLPAVQLLRPQGRHGELLAEPYTDLAILTAGLRVWLAATEHSEPSQAAERVLEQAWQPTGRNAGRVVVKLQGTDSISAAEALMGQFLLMRAADLPPLDADTFRVRDLVGCSLLDEDRLVGTVVDVQFPIAADGKTRLADAPDLLAVLPVADGATQAEAEDGDTVLVPFVRDWLIEVDLQTRRIRMRLPPGLFDSEEHSDTLDAANPRP